MKKLSDTIADLAAMRAGAPRPADGGASGRLGEMDRFGSNPGALSAKTYVPDRLAANPALVVVLHGCTQTAAGYDQGSGWSQLADKHGFALLFPEQRRANNPNLCFNWFSPADNARDRGEALSIRQMIAAMVETHGIDASRVFVTGLSAGGAMASILLATYPELFAGGAIMAGLPYGCASNVSEAFEAMRGAGHYQTRDPGGPIRKASGHEGPWPSISIWHGTADGTVSPANADAVLAQWLSVHGLDPTPDVTETVAGHPRRIWKDASGRVAVEDYRIAGMGHGTPLATRGEDGCGMAAPFMLEVGLSSTRRLAALWGLVEQTAAQPAPVGEAGTSVGHDPRRARLERLSPSEVSPAHPPKSGVQKVIEDALRAAGLMR